MRRVLLLSIVLALIALSGCGGDGGTEMTSTQAVHATHAAWEGMPCGNSAVITYDGCGAAP
jgi:hypothetical protein